MRHFICLLLFPSVFDPLYTNPSAPIPIPFPPPFTSLSLSLITANSTLYYEKYAAYYYEQASKNGAAPNSAPTTLVAISVTPLPNGQVEEIIDIPEQHIGRVIGKGGSAIRSIQQTASVKLEVPNECVPGTSVRRAKLTGTQAANAYARQMIEEKMRGNEARQHQLSQPLSGNLADPILSRVVPVPNDDAGRIIGKGGNTIRQLQEQSRARVEIEKAPKPGANVREVTITGTAQQIAMVEAMIAQKLKGEPSSGASQQQQQPVTEIKVLMPAEFVGR